MKARNIFDKNFILNNVSVDKNKCWIWNGTIEKFGYGTTSFKGKEYRIHRLSMHLYNGFDLSSSLYVCHHCDNPPCCNPEHLFVGTQKDNMQDSLRKGRHVDNSGSRHGKAKLREEDVILIRALAKDWKQIEIARHFCLTRDHVNAIIKNKIWRHI